jgi:tripartite ATP-independent transporter DctM subunit
VSVATPDERSTILPDTELAEALHTGPDTRTAAIADRIIMVIGNLAAWVSAALVAADLGLVFCNVISRYFFDAPFGGWADDTTIIILISLAFFGGTVALARNEHPGIAIIAKHLPPKAAEVAGGLRACLILIFTIYVVVATWSELPITAKQASPSGLPLSYHYYPLLVAAIAMAAIALCRVISLKPRSLIASIVILGGIAVIWYFIYYYVIGDTFNPSLLMIGAFLVVMAIGVPIGFALGMAAMVYVVTALPALPVAFVAGRMVAGVDNFELLAVPFFVAAGVLMEAAGVFTYLLYLIRLLLGRIRGGLNIVTVVSLYVFSGVSGSRTADIAAVGKLIMPEYRVQKKAPEGLALIAAGACVGETVPPSTELLIIASLANLSVGALFTAGILPAAVLAIVLIIVSVVYKPVGFHRDEVSRSLKAKLTAMLHAILALLLPVILLGGVAGGIATPTEVSSFAVVYALVLGLIVYRNIGPRQLLKLAIQTATLTGILLFIFANATMISWLVAIQSFPHDLTSFVERVSGSNGTWVFMLLTIAVLLFMGWLMEGLPALVILLPLMMPTAQALGIDPIQYAMVMAIAMDVGVTAPPFGLGLFTASAIGGVSVERLTPHVLRYLAVLVVGLILIAFVPDITLALPRLFGLVH